MKEIKLTPKRKEIVELMNFNSIFDVLTYFPFRYEHYKTEKLSYSMHNKKVTFDGTISSKVKIDRITGGRMKTTFTLTNNSDMVKVVMFNKFANTKFLYEGAKLVISGKYNAFINEITVSSFFIGCNARSGTSNFDLAVGLIPHAVIARSDATRQSHCVDSD